MAGVTVEAAKCVCNTRQNVILEGGGGGGGGGVDIHLEDYYAVHAHAVQGL